MEAPTGHSDNAPGGNRYRIRLSASDFIRAPIYALLEYSGFLSPRSSQQEAESLVLEGSRHALQDSAQPSGNVGRGSSGEVSIRIIGPAEQEQERLSHGSPSTLPTPVEVSCLDEAPLQPVSGSGELAFDGEDDLRSEHDGAMNHMLSPSSTASVDAEAFDGGGVTSNRDSTYQRYDIQLAASCIEHVLPFSLLLLVVFIRQHLQGFFVTIWIAVVMFKSNDVIRKQTALKGERKFSILVGICIVFTLHVVGAFWWYRHDDLLYPLIMFPPKAIPPFWHAVFIIMVNGICNLLHGHLLMRSSSIRYIGPTGSHDSQVYSTDVLQK